MDFDLAPEYEKLIATVREFGEQHFTCEAVRQWQHDAGLPDEHHIGHVVDGHDEHNDNGGQAHLENGFPHGCAFKKFFGFHENFPLDFMFAMRYYKINNCSVNTSITRGDLENNR